MSKYFDGYASFDYKEMSKEKLITELKEKVRYIGELKRNNNKEIAKVQSIKDKTIADLETKLAEREINITNEDFEKEVEKAQQKINQDKISFAVEQLELLKNCKIVVPNMLNIKDTNFYVSLKAIDNQINELKENSNY